MCPHTLSPSGCNVRLLLHMAERGSTGYSVTSRRWFGWLETIGFPTPSYPGRGRTRGVQSEILLKYCRRSFEYRDSCVGYHGAGIFSSAKSRQARTGVRNSGIYRAVNLFRRHHPSQHGIWNTEFREWKVVPGRRQLVFLLLEESLRDTFEPSNQTAVQALTQN